MSQIARHWRGVAFAQHAAEYVEHLRTETLPKLTALDGFVAASILRRDVDAGVEFVVLTRWRSLDSIEAFSGADRERAVVPDTARRLLREFDARARHYEVVESHGAADSCGAVDASGAAERTERALRPVELARCALRTHRGGDVGWIVQRHAELYLAEYGWGCEFEALVAEIAARFLREFDPSRERCWIAERAGERVGCVMLVRHQEREGVAKLRLLLVDPRTRGCGLGAELVRACTDFARSVGYHTITLWTNSVLDAARVLYVRERYVLVDERPHRQFGDGLVGQTWELALR